MSNTCVKDLHSKAVACTCCSRARAGHKLKVNIRLGSLEGKLTTAASMLCPVASSNHKGGSLAAASVATARLLLLLLRLRLLLRLAGLLRLWRLLPQGAAGTKPASAAESKSHSSLVLLGGSGAGCTACAARAALLLFGLPMPSRRSMAPPPPPCRRADDAALAAAAARASCRSHSAWKLSPAGRISATITLASTSQLPLLLLLVLAPLIMEWAALFSGASCMVRSMLLPAALHTPSLARMMRPPLGASSTCRVVPEGQAVGHQGAGMQGGPMRGKDMFIAGQVEIVICDGRQVRQSTTLPATAAG